MRRGAILLWTGLLLSAGVGRVVAILARESCALARPAEVAVGLAAWGVAFAVYGFVVTRLGM